MFKKFLFGKDNILFNLFLLLIVFIPLYPKFPLINVYGTYVAIRLEDILIALVALIAIILNIPKLKTILDLNLTKLFIFFWIIGLISVLSGLFITFTVEPSLSLLHFLRRIEYMSLFFIAFLAVKSKLQLKIILISTVITLALVIIYGFGQIFVSFPVISTTNREFSKGQILTLTPGARPNSTFAGHYDLAIYLSVIVVFLAAYFLSVKNYLAKALLGILGFAGFALLGMTAARSSFVGALSGIGLYFFLIGKRWLIVGLVVLSIITIASVPQLRDRLIATVTVNLLEGGGPKYAPSQEILDLSQKEGSFSASYLNNGEDASSSATSSAYISRDIAPGEPINTTELGVFRSYNIRLDVEWPRAIRAFARNPLLGTGYSSITIATDNGYLRSLGEVGLLGTFALAMILMSITKSIIKGVKGSKGGERVFLLSTLCMLVIVAKTLIFFDVLEASKVATLFWAYLGIAWSISKNYEAVK